MATKNTTIRFEEKMIDEIDQSCQDGECTRNDWMKDAASEKLHRENTQDQEVIKNTEPKPKEPKTHTVEVDFDPKDYEIGKAEPKATVELIPKEIIKEVPQDNSNKQIYFKQVAGKLMPFAKRYNT